MKTAPLEPKHRAPAPAHRCRASGAVQVSELATIDVALYFALCNARRRVPEEMNGPLFVAGLGEGSHLKMSEERFRTCVAESLTNYVHADGSFLPGADFW